MLSYVLSRFTNIDVIAFIANYIERGDINLHFSVRITVQQLFEVSYQSNSDEIQCTKSYSREVPYSRKVWRGESLVNLANLPQFAKLKPSKLVFTINNLLVDLLICQTFPL